ncbi:fungal-specific transcription factor domain protein [Talaromyces proteolyticus]|uniref:Fungal-specific transcription factor domain protein n=1 Tax=Talaromyces proteolyticus TaxID=1131652 RepID=A0AAD4PXT8_9EURO|nr:fungal-specific transcription factor domain protein [Talaromyces proteolyticus]KAH8700400.1 fungal-specific transcription factor domain protein [Talaromyces proteolyticus]
MRMHSHGANYVGSVHWAAILDSISELKDHYQEEEEARVLTTNDYLLPDILASIPARPVVDRMVGRHFNAQGLTPRMYIPFDLNVYESFWKDPDTTSFTYIGLLFSIMCLSVQSNQLSEDPADPEALMRVYLFRERTVQCLVLGQFTRGGAYVLETIINYCTSEVLLCKDADIGLWLLLGMLVQLALSQGYHRDPRNFPKISPFDGEMRRRVWAAVRQIDLRLSSQMGLPRLLQSQQYDTADPRNLLDSDFDETTVEIPPSRSDTEVTPVLYVLAKNRIDSVGGLIGDLVADTRKHPYSEIMDLDQKLQDAEASLPSIFRWQPLSQPFMVPPLIVLHRVWLQIAVQRLTICLHRKYLAPPYTELRYKYSRNSCVQAAIKMLEYQRLIDEETQPDGQLHSVRWVSSSLLQTTFLLGMSVLCYYVQLAKTTPDLSLGQETDTKIYDLLRDTYPMWLRSSIVSRDARDAVERLRRLLGLPNQQDSGKFAQEECIANFTVAFDADFLTLEAGGSSSGVFS